jgi:hypothetical protein
MASAGGPWEALGTPKERCEGLTRVRLDFAVLAVLVRDGHEPGRRPVTDDADVVVSVVGAVSAANNREPDDDLASALGHVSPPVCRKRKSHVSQFATQVAALQQHRQSSNFPLYPPTNASAL